MALIVWAESLSRRLLRDIFPRRWAHVQAVANRAAWLASALNEADGATLLAAAWLHDIGYAPGLSRTGFHPLDGARYLRLINAPNRLADLVAFHSSAASEGAVLGLGKQMSEFDDEQTIVRDLLWYADMTTGPGGECMTFDRRIEDVRERYAPDHYVIRALDAGMGERRAAVERAQRWIESAGFAG